MSKFNPFTNKDADFTEPISKDGDFQDIVSDIAFDGQTRRQFLRRLSNGLVGIGAVNRMGQIVYKTHDDRVIGGHRVNVNVESRLQGVKTSFEPDGKYKGERGHLVMPVNIQSSGMGSLDKEIQIFSKCEHETGYQYESNEFINSIQGKETVYPIITTKKKISEFGKPNNIHISVIER